MPSRDAVEFLLHEHEVAKAKFAEIEQTPPPLRAELWRALQPELKVHELVEDTYLYGPLVPAIPGRPARPWPRSRSSRPGRRGVEQLMGEADALDPASDAWLAKILAIRDALAQHIAVEETEILPQIPRSGARGAADAAGAQMQEAKLRQTGKVAG